MSKPEWQRIKLAKRIAGASCMDCEYLVDSKCSVYQDRPFMCRLFGATLDAKIACPYGCGPASPLTVQQAHMLLRRYIKLTGQPVAYTVEQS
jgi:Fe-S-cluster containining protein